MPYQTESAKNTPPLRSNGALLADWQYTPMPPCGVRIFQLAALVFLAWAAARI